MDTMKTHLIEFAAAVFIFGAGLLYLNKEYLAVKQLTDAVSNKVIEEPELYQQYNRSTIDEIPEEELIAVIMGYREYPIIIDGVTMEVVAEHPEDYLQLIKDGYYKKSYGYDTKHSIVTVIFTYAGTA